MTGPGFRPPVTLRGRFVEMVPLERAHIPGLAHAGRDPEVWRLLRIGPGRNEAEMTVFVEEMLALQATGAILPFTVLGLPERAPVGFFRFLDIDRENRWVEFGTWLDSTRWRTPVNTEVKYLALRYAFESEECHRVQLRTDLRNERSQRAIERLGGVREGIHREHFRRRDGTYRTSVVYSILVSEWPQVKRRLEEKLARPWPGPSPSPKDAGRGPTAGGTSEAASPGTP
jgi:N-acetyltransferase